MRLRKLAGVAGILLLAGLLFSGCSNNAAEDTSTPSGSGKGQTTTTAPTATTSVQLNR